jgi:large repetitive protein
MSSCIRTPSKRMRSVSSFLGSDTAVDVEVDDIPTNLEITSISAPCETGFPCDLGDLSDQAEVAITVTATIESEGAFGNAATVSSETDDPEPDNNSDDDGDTASSAEASLSLTKMISQAPDPIVEGSLLEYTVTATNAGDVDLFDVVITDDMITPSSVTCLLVGRGEICELTGTYMVTQADMVAGEIINTATANGDDPQGNPVPE